jgi:formylglycine-generating enzyme required for sulfatase activity
MTQIPGGVFQMGSNDGAKDEKPVHEVKVSAFCMDTSEVTVAAYDDCTTARGCEPPSTTVNGPKFGPVDVLNLSKDCNAAKPDKRSFPINCVDWKEATAFCAWAKKRLPTEEEWEFVARGGDEQRKFAWGSEPPGAKRLNARGPEFNENRVGKTMYSESDGFHFTAPVGSFPAGDSRWGLHDMAGNVWEWTSSGYSEDYEKPRTPEFIVNRGGGWLSIDPTNARGAVRSKELPTSRLLDLGFRCVR